ncbi:hypothetical protein [Parapedobacter lycopersici]|uniref:hypothetical protein n=1 Tax=Parapedobacter lycopersici TaxID=1864939 RepID=UPI00214D44E5|nr:hypothetical protein [Parapedobacter lycopersici]
MGKYKRQNRQTKGHQPALRAAIGSLSGNVREFFESASRRVRLLFDLASGLVRHGFDSASTALRGSSQCNPLRSEDLRKIPEEVPNKSRSRVEAVSKPAAPVPEQR